MKRQQPDLFENQLAPPRPSIGIGDPAKVRVKLHALLEELRGGSSRLDYIQTVFPQMVRWLPEAEAAELLAAFRSVGN